MVPFQWLRALMVIGILCVPSLLTAQPGQEAQTEQKEQNLSIQVFDAAVATGIESLTPQGVSDVFPSHVGTLYAFSKVEGAEKETHIFHRWYHQEKLLAEIKLPVRSKSWRTYSSKIILPEWTGDWKVEMTGAEGTVLHTLSFRVE